MQNNQVVVRFIHSCEAETAVSKSIGRITGLINAENFIKLMNVLGVDSNPRKPKESYVTKEIIDTLDENPELFHLMSKGILVSASRCEVLDRNRFKLGFEDQGYAMPGILDGGHNTFAIAKYILKCALTEQEMKKISDWESLMFAWNENKDIVEDILKSQDDGQQQFTFLIPIEVIFPRHPDDEDNLKDWGDIHRDITHARNNNVQLTDSTKAHHQGFYDYLKETLPPEICAKVEWKTNDKGSIKAADIVALALIPLSKLSQDVTGVEINLTKIYNSKQYCVETFQAILEKEVDGKCVHGAWKGQTFELSSLSIKSALDLVADVIKAYDYIYKKFPNAYNLAGGSFGKITGVRIYDPSHNKDKKYSAKPFSTKFYGEDCDYSYADGFIVPIVVGLRELIKIDSASGMLSWACNPINFLEANFVKILGMYSAIIRATNWDPQKIGKDKGSYEIVSGAVQIAAATYKP